MKRTEEADPKVLQQLSEKQKAQKYKYRKEDGKYLSSFFSILKLVLINGELFSKYLERSIVETEKNRLNALIQKEIYYIINVQSEEEKAMANGTGAGIFRKVG